MNILDLVKKAEQKKQRLYQAQLAHAKTSACPFR